MDNLADLSPEILWMKFDKVVKDAQSQRGHYREFIAALDKRDNVEDIANLAETTVVLASK